MSTQIALAFLAGMTAGIYGAIAYSALGHRWARWRREHQAGE